MEKEEQERVKAVVEEILAEADMSEVTERNVRDLAARRTGIDLSQNRQWRTFVSNVIVAYFGSIDYEAVSKRSAVEDLKPAREEEEATGRETSRDSDSEEEMEDIKMKEDVNGEECENSEEVVQRGGKRPKYETDAEGNHIICELSAKRKVVVSQWKGRTLVSVREYYEKDGKILPTSKGISLTVEQFDLLAKATHNIDRAISSME